MIAIIIILIWIKTRLLVIAVYFWHLSGLVTTPDISEYFLKASKASELFLLSFKLDISDAVDVGEAGE
jgi:hypothetical protein